MRQRDARSNALADGDALADRYARPNALASHGNGQALPAIQAYAEAVCVQFAPSDGTWGNGAERLEVQRDHLASVDPPTEAEAWHEAWLGIIEATLMIFRSMPAHELADGPTIREHPDVVAALAHAETVRLSPEANRHMEDARC